MSSGGLIKTDKYDYFVGLFLVCTALSVFVSGVVYCEVRDKLEVVKENATRYQLQGFSVRSPEVGRWLIADRQDNGIIFSYIYSGGDDSLSAAAGLFDVPFTYSSETEFLDGVSDLLRTKIVPDEGVVERRQVELDDSYGAYCVRSIYITNNVAIDPSGDPVWRFNYEGLVCAHPALERKMVVAAFQRLGRRKVDSSIFRREAERYFDGIDIEK